ncbi:hypothetical protein LSCM1_02749 [Leishmania martiniquensis]|uniref:Diphthamide synthesis protein n=1 Tax=Leishmania martiniquensis TaxID=1580590 RepID=A0A836H282_9TRYP|nr:hypothetical protein LSCM1_02749 [Leishmania martiniquensis]
MFHDAPVEAVVGVHRHRQRFTGAAFGDVAEDKAAQLIIDGYQLHHVTDFVLTGTTDNNAEAMVPQPADPVTESCGGATPSCGRCCVNTAAVPSGRGYPYMRVALQFPDELLGDAVAVVHCLHSLITRDGRYADAIRLKEAEGDAKGELHGLNAGALYPLRPQGPAAPGAAAQLRPATMDNPHCSTSAIRLFVLADNTFGSCCPDEITAQHYSADCIVHFGDACMSRSTRLPVLYVHPVFHFHALATNAVSGGDGARALLDAEATVVLEVVQRVASAIHHRLTDWWATKAEATRASAGAPSPLCPRIAIVGAYSAKAIVQAAERRWSATGDPSLLVEWPVFEERSLLAAAELEKSHSPRSTEKAHAAGDFQGEGFWVVSGVRFPRLSASPSPTPSNEVQYLLFIGGADSSALVHVLAAERYNQFHYSELCREYLEWDDGNTMNNVPVVCVLDDNFGDMPATKEYLHSAVRCLAEDGSASSVYLELTDAVQQWVSATFADGVAAALATKECVRAQQKLQRRSRQRAFNIESVRASSAIGILVASLAIEGYYEVTQQLHQLIRAYGKRSYVIYVGHLNEFKLANFADTLDCFVAVACPYSQQSHFPEKEDGFMKPIVSPAEVLVALTSADDDARVEDQYGMAAVYTASFPTVLQALKDAVQARRSKLESRASGTEAFTAQGQNGEDERWASSGALVRTGTGRSGGALVEQSCSQGALARLYDREYVGLDPRVGQTPVQPEVLEGKHGIARGYAKERQGQEGQPPGSL